MSRSNWACFHCREALRRETSLEEPVACPSCGDPCQRLGTRYRVPPRDDGRGWARLKETWQARTRSGAESSARERVRRIHDLERRIAELKALPDNRERAKLLTELRKSLEELRSRP
ncbi:MAG: hypothetical protein RL885_29450 [Planctomycetota bacterium]